jgi:hypothetical protein
VLVMVIELEFYTPGPNSWTSTSQVGPLAPISRIERHGERQRKKAN